MSRYAMAIERSHGRKSFMVRVDRWLTGRGADRASKVVIYLALIIGVFFAGREWGRYQESVPRSKAQTVSCR